MALNAVYQPADAIVSSNFSPYSPSVSRVRQAGPSSTIRSTPSAPGNMGLRKTKGDAGERAPLLGAHAGAKKVKKPFYRPRPMWLVPFAVVASIVRGMTLAPRVQVYTQLSCNAIYGHDVYDHTNTTLLPEQPTYPSLYSSLDPAGPHMGVSMLHSLNSDSPLVSLPSPSFTTNNSTNEDDDDDDDEPDPRMVPSKRCLSDPAVQVGAARIQTIMTTIMGALSALSTGWWGHFGERHGRLKVLAASTAGLFLTDLTFILVSTPHSIFAAHGHKLLVISPFIEGLLGGWSTLQGAASAYVSDCTSDGSRAHVFSRFTGVFYLGFSLGPTIGAFLIRHPIFPVAAGSGSGSSSHHVHNGAPMVTSVFYVAAMCSFVNLLLALFVFPESLDKKGKQQQSPLIQDDDDVDRDEERKGLGFFARILSPLALFMPKKLQMPEGNHRYDWSLTLLAIAFFGYLLSTGIFQIKYLYAEHVYQWGAEQLSYYISFMGGARAVHTLLIMPWIITTFKPRPKSKSKPTQSTTPSTSLLTRSAPLAPLSTVIPPSPTTPAKKPKPTLLQLAKEISFDLLLIRVSLLIDLLSHTLVSLASTGVAPQAFVAFTTLNSFGAGLVPAANSFALCVMQMQAAAANLGGSGGEVPGVDGGAGRLFGALAVLQAVGQMILGPMLFGLIYGTTVRKYPKTIFMTAAAILFCSIVAVSLIRSDVSFKSRQQRRRVHRARDDDEIERGRSRASKDLSAGSPASSGSTRSVGLGIQVGEEPSP